jgi:hypothetical protein
MRFVFAIIAVTGVSVAIAGLEAAPPKNVDLTALWKINPALSDDPQKILAKKRDDSAGGGRAGGAHGGSRTGSSTGVDIGDILGGGTIVLGGGRKGGGAGGSADRPAGDPEPATQRMPLDAFLATRDEFEIEQRPDALTVRTLDETSTCKPGKSDKVPLPSGELADLRCGWQGATFVTELESEDGVMRVTRYELRKNGKQLAMTSEIKGGRGQLSGLQIRRIYDRLVAF